MLYNLTNINITERLRRSPLSRCWRKAFTAGETAKLCIPGENLVALTGMGPSGADNGAVSPIGFVMYNIDIDMIAFDVHIAPLSLSCTVLFSPLLFTWIVDYEP